MIEVFKIKDPYYERFSSGLKNGFVSKSKKGKTWSSIGALKNHIKAALLYDYKAFELFYDNWVVLKLSENGVEQVGLVKDFKQN
jgi:hypothetical protein